MADKRIIIGGGGTGGHVFPAISIAQALVKKAPGIRILFVGAEDKLEMEKVPEAGFEIRGLPVTGLQRKLSFKNVTFLIKLWRSLRRSATIIQEFKPDIAVGVGGYASGPILRAAARKKIPIFIQEQNSYAGLTNRLLAKKANKIFVAYDGMEKYFPGEKVIITGNPVRKDILDLGKKRAEGFRYFNLDEDKPVVLSIGGSLGAGTINNSLLKGIGKYGDEVQLIWQTGQYYFESLREQLKNRKEKNIKLYPFIRNMDLAFSVADIIISRAGAGTISELALAGKPVILVPSPNVADDHQTRNAMALVNKDAAVYVKDSEAEKVLVDTCIELLGNIERRKVLADNIQSMAIPDSAERIANEILKVK